MAASTNVISSIDLLIKAGGNLIGCTTGGSLTLNQALDDAFCDGSGNWMGKTTGARSWSVSADSLVDAAGGSVLTGHDADTPLAVTIDGDVLKGLTEAGINLSLQVSEFLNATTGMNRSLDPSARMLELSLSFDAYDPAGQGNDALDTVLDRLINGGDALSVAVVCGPINISFDAFPSTSSQTKSTGDILKNGLTLVSHGEVTNDTVGMGAGFSGLFAAFFAEGAATPLTVLVGTTTADNTEYEGQALPASVGITIPYAGQATTSVTLEGSGPLVRRATPAA